jgi:hypothetical protein
MEIVVKELSFIKIKWVLLRENKNGFTRFEWIDDFAFKEISIRIDEPTFMINVDSQSRYSLLYEHSSSLLIVVIFNYPHLVSCLILFKLSIIHVSIPKVKATLYYNIIFNYYYYIIYLDHPSFLASIIPCIYLLNHGNNTSLFHPSCCLSTHLNRHPHSCKYKFLILGVYIK